MDLNGLPVFVTGGGSGLGAATARLMAAKGAKVACFDLNKDNAEKVAKEIGGIGIGGDVSSEADAKAALDAAEKAHGVARVLVNCAGIGNAITTVNKNGAFPLDAFKKIIDVNLIGSFNMLRLAAERMSKQEPVGEERGVVINTASVAAFDGQVGQAAYSASKGGIVGMTLPIARDLARNGIRNMTIAPGIFGTPMLFTMPKEVQDALAASVPFPSRLGTPADYAKLVLHIVTNDMLNGEVIRIDGAIRLAPK